MVIWSIFSRALLIIFVPALGWKLAMDRTTDPMETAVSKVLTLVACYFGTWWGLRKSSWSEFRIALIGRQYG
jgi:hypothetical protein